MGLAEELAKSDDLFSHKSRQKCRTTQLLQLLDQEDREALLGLLYNPRFKGVDIVKFLNRYATTLDGSDASTLYVRELCSTITPTGLQRHRRGACTCGGNSDRPSE